MLQVMAWDSNFDDQRVAAIRDTKEKKTNSETMGDFVSRLSAAALTKLKELESSLYR